MLKYIDGYVIDTPEGHVVSRVDILQVSTGILGVFKNHGLDPDLVLDNYARYMTSFYMQIVCKENSLVFKDPLGVTNHVYLCYPVDLAKSTLDVLKPDYLTDPEEHLLIDLDLQLMSLLKSEVFSKEVKYDPVGKAFIVTTYSPPSSRRYILAIENKLRTEDSHEPNELIMEEIKRDFLDYLHFINYFNIKP